jgi:hypothetical protein
VVSRAAGPVLGRRTLNRTLLARQWLSRRHDGTATDVIGHLVGLQAQSPSAPYVGVATRLTRFAHDDLAATLLDRSAVRIVTLRGTIHWSLADDALALRRWVQPGLDRGLATTWGRDLDGVDYTELAGRARELLGDATLSGEELGRLLAEDWPAVRPSVLVNGVRVLLPLVQVPPRGVWGGSGATTYATAQSWLGAADTAPDVGADRTAAHDFVRRYLGAFGPASVRDIQAWCGLTRLKEVVSDLGDEVRRYRDESGTELVDLADLEPADADDDLPPIFVAPFDNVILSHADRTRIISDPDRKAITRKNGIVPGTVLIDGFVAGIWRVDVEDDTATVVVEPFRRLPPRVVSSLTRPGEAIAAVVADTASRRGVRVEQPG